MSKRQVQEKEKINCRNQKKSWILTVNSKEIYEFIQNFEKYLLILLTLCVF